jgi:hypothetical protein
MADDTQTTQGTQATQSTPQPQGNDATPVKLYATKDEAAAKLADAAKSLRPFEVSKAGAVVGWGLGRGYDYALATVARIDGYSVGTGVKQAPVTKEVVTAKVMEMSDDEFKTLVAARKAAAKGGK